MKSQTFTLRDGNGIGQQFIPLCYNIVLSVSVLQELSHTTLYVKASGSLDFSLQS